MAEPSARTLPPDHRSFLTKPAKPTPSVLRGDLARSTLDTTDSVAAGGQGGENGTLPAGTDETGGQSFASSVISFVALVALAGGLATLINQRRKKHRRRAKAVLLRDILASDDEEDEADMPLLGLGSTRYRGNSATNLNLAHMPVFDFIRKEFRAADNE